MANDNYIGNPMGDYGWEIGQTAVDVQPSTPKPETAPPILADPEKRIQTLQYPKSGGNDHFVRFYININEESRLLKIDKVSAERVDQTSQMRLNQGTATQQSIAIGSGIAVSVWAASKAAGASATALRDLFGRNNSIPLPKGYKVGANIAAGGATIGAGIVGAVAGAAIGASSAESFGMTNKLYRLASTITLYSPGNIRSNYNMEYSLEKDLLADLAQSDQQEAVVKAIMGTGDANRGLAHGLLRTLATTNSTVSILSKTAVNSKRDVMFKRVGNRTFQFEYVFAPRSADEAREVANIIYMFKFFAHPEVLPGYGNFLYLYPAEFDIEYRLKTGYDENGKVIEQINDNLNKISSCVITNIDINYAPNGSFQSLANGEPVITTMSLNFMEIEALHQARIKDGF